jgi:probable phosphoglycerate mutase
MRLILIRHAETEHNRDNRVQGRADNPLSEVGVRQAAALAAALRGQEIAAVVSSPLQRAQSTARAVADAVGVSLVTEPDLVEMHVGEMEGISTTEMRERYADFLKEWATEHGATLPLPGGESLVEVQERAWAVVQRLRERYAEQTLALVSHNFVLGCLITRSLGLPVHAFRRFRLSVASATTLNFRADRTMLVQLNDTCHLAHAGLPSTDPWPAPPRA